MSARSRSRQGVEPRFTQRAAQVRGRRVKVWLIALLVLLGTIALTWLIAFSSVFTVRDVEVTGADAADRDRIAQIAREQSGVPLARVDGDAVAEHVMDEVPSVRSADIDRGWPKTLKVNVTSRVPVLAVTTEGDRYDLVDMGGVRIRTVTKESAVPKGVPIVTAEDGAEVSGHGVKAARGMLESLPKDLRERVSEVTVDDADQVSFRLGEQTEIVWGDESSPDVKVKVITILLEKKPKVIDVSAPDTPVTKG